MQTHRKISPILPKRIILSSPVNHQVFLCKNPKFPFTLHLDSVLKYQYQYARFNYEVQEQKNVLKIFRGLKNIKKIHQNNHALSRIKLPASKNSYFIKRVKRVETLDIQDQDQPSPEKFSPARLNLWLKYGKSLKSVNYQFAAKMKGDKASIALVEREVQQSLKFLPRHRDLVSFQIRLPISSSKPLESLLEFQRYPASIKTFVISQEDPNEPQISNDDLVISAFSRLKNLESLTLKGERLLKVGQILFEKLPFLLNIKKLNVQVFRINPLGPGFDLNVCQALQNLQHLEISNIDKGMGLYKLTNPPQLKSLDIRAKVDLEGIALISQFLSLFSKSLKSFGFEIKHLDEEEAEEKIKTLFSKISKLEMLTSLKLKFFPANWKKQVDLSPGILENLKRLFLKPVKLESFQWEVPRISGPGILLDLLRLLEGSCGTLRKLEIEHPKMELERSQEVLIFKFLRRLERIEVLCLTSFKIREEKFWVDLVDSFLGMKFLSSLSIGGVYSGLRAEWFINSLEKILKKRGLEVLWVDAFGARGARGDLDLKEIMKANPSLKEVSDDVGNLFESFWVKLMTWR